jgi:hypothetical protein
MGLLQSEASADVCTAALLLEVDPIIQSLLSAEADRQAKVANFQAENLIPCFRRESGVLIACRTDNLLDQLFDCVPSTLGQR